ncbi:MAG: HTTM domain-containing protein [Verrucomicrobiae bacterium]|nr:HTTM domain-containing protein [Verrucomicrobiae bacterium]
MIGKPRDRCRNAWSRLESFWFGAADARVYAIVRIVFSAVALANLVDLWPHRIAFFTEGGMIDRETLLRVSEGKPYFSIFYHVTSPAGVSAVFVVAAAALVCLGLGVAPRFAALLVLLWHLGYTQRAFVAIHGWDIMLRTFSFFLLVSPLGKPWTLARWLKGGHARRAELLVSRHGLLLMQLQLAVMYWHTVWLKVVDPFWRSGEFLSFFMLSFYSRFPYPFFAKATVLIAILTYATLVIELIVPNLLWCRRTRALGFLLGTGLHLTILLVTQIWLFSIIALMPYFAFLDGHDVDRALRLARRRKNGRDHELLG